VPLFTWFNREHHEPLWSFQGARGKSPPCTRNA